MLSHYEFKQHLTNKCSEYGCNFLLTTEEHASQCCSKIQAPPEKVVLCESQTLLEGSSQLVSG